MSCACDYDPCAIWDAKMVTARRQHRCCECGDTIESGEAYERVKTLFDGHWSTYATCDCCRDQWESLIVQTGGCRLIGGLHEALDEAYHG